MALSPAEVATYHDEGLVIPNFSLSSEQLGGLKEDCARVMTDNPEVGPDAYINAHFEKSDKRAEGVTGGDRIRAYGTLPEVLDMVELIIGPDIIMWGSTIFAKPAGTGLEVPWHQDAHYWPLRPVAAITVWMAIDDAMPENGCMRYIPGSHRGAVLSHHLVERPDVALSQEIQAGLFDESLSKNDALKAGQMSLHDCYLIHGSNANRSGNWRAGIAFRYTPATTHYDRSIPPMPYPGGKVVASHLHTRPIFLVRGENRNPLNDLNVGH